MTVWYGVDRAHRLIIGEIALPNTMAHDSLRNDARLKKRHIGNSRQVDHRSPAFQRRTSHSPCARRNHPACARLPPEADIEHVHRRIRSRRSCGSLRQSHHAAKRPAVNPRRTARSAAHTRPCASHAARCTPGALCAAPGARRAVTPASTIAGGTWKPGARAVVVQPVAQAVRQHRPTRASASPRLRQRPRRPSS